MVRLSYLRFSKLRDRALKAGLGSPYAETVRHSSYHNVIETMLLGDEIFWR